jgi:hypothetical protein
MRLLFALLVVANLALAVYGLLAPRANSPDAALLERQTGAEQIRIVPPRPAPARRAACVEWGGFADAEVSLARRELAELDLGAKLTETRAPAAANWWVYIPPLPERPDVERKLGELQALGVSDYFVVEGEGPMRNAISLGIFRSEQAAFDFLEELRGMGVRSARVGAREQRLTQVAFLVREPDARTSARLAELAIRFRGTELKALDCPM